MPHHISQWGNNRQDVFFVDDDRPMYLRRLKERCEVSGVRVLAYCLMTLSDTSLFLTETSVIFGNDTMTIVNVNVEGKNR